MVFYQTPRYIFPLVEHSFSPKNNFGVKRGFTLMLRDKNFTVSHSVRAQSCLGH